MKKKIVQQGIVYGLVIVVIGMCFVPAIGARKLQGCFQGHDGWCALSDTGAYPLPDGRLSVGFDRDGTTFYVGGSGPGNYTRIQDAIDNASNGDTVFVFSGIYHEHVGLRTGLNLIGEDILTTVIEWNNGITVWSAPYSTIRGFTIRNAGYQAGIFGCVEHITVSNNMIFTNRGPGIFLEATDYAVIADNTIVTYGEWQWDLEYGCGIYLMADRYDNCLYNTFINNTIINNGYGAGICLQGYSHYMWGYEHTTISGNTIIGNSSAPSVVGIYLDADLITTTINSNTIRHYEYGIFLYSCGQNTIINNTVIENSYGIYLWDASNNRIYHNNLIANEVNGVTGDGNQWDDGYPSGGNYWSDYTGVDQYSGPGQNETGSDGIGDTPYLIPGGSNRDHYPLMNPNGWERVSSSYSYVTLSGGGLVTCPAGDGPAYQYTTVTVRDFDGEPIPGIPADQCDFTVSPTDDTQWYGIFGCTLTPVDPMTDENGEIRFTIQGDTSIVGNITIQATVMGYQLQDTDILPCKSIDSDTNGAVDLADFILFGRDYGTTAYWSDFTWDGTVGLSDFIIFGQHWGHHQ
jgi:parallel beta-helix repeat protein